MKKIFFKGRFIFIPLGIIACLSLVGFVVMALWNNLLPEIMNVRPITFWQALGIFILCKILFGFGGGRHKGGPPWMKHKCGNMSPEEKEKFRAEMKERMCFMKSKHTRTEENTEQQNT